LRDGMLAVSGLLSLKESGSSVYPELPAELKAAAKGWPTSPSAEERNRRSVYVAVRRNLRYPLLRAFDAPDAAESCARRFATTTAPQALTLLNDPIIQEMARAFADRVKREAGDDVSKQIDRAFQLALGRLPTDEERSAVVRFLEKRSAVDLCHA